jgi:hypothetical protein
VWCTRSELIVRRVRWLVVGLICGLASPAAADDAPIVGTIRDVDAAGHRVTLDTTANGRARRVVLDVVPETRIVRFASRRGEGPGVVEVPAGVEALRPGWIVSVVTRHDGAREIAVTMKVVVEP